MKNIVSITLAAAIGAVLFSSCNKLSESPAGSLTPTEFFKTQTDAVDAVTAAYSTLSTDINNDFPIYGRNLNLLVDNTSDNQVYSPSNTNPDVRALGTATYVSTNDRVHKIYSQLYWGIDKANLAIDGIQTIPASQFSTYSQPNLIREARFLRALHYFNLVRLFGDVPLVLHDAGTIANAQTLVSRTPKDSIYAQIIADLDSAALLPPPAQTTAGRATSGSALALLAKVYVTRHDWADAVTTLQKIITIGTAGLTTPTTGNFGYDLFPSFLQAFQPGTKNGREHIFSAQFNGSVGGGFIAEQNLSSFNFSSSAYLSDQPASDYVITSLFNVADQRRTYTFYDSLYNTSLNTQGTAPIGWVKWPYFQFFKFVDQSGGGTFPDYPNSLGSSQGLNSKINFTILRYADVLLLYAEALNELNNGPTADAYTAINIVRARAFGSYTANGNYSNHTYDLTPSLSYINFKDSVFDERRREFIQESQRWFDLVRRAPDPEYGPGEFYLQKVLAMPGNPKAAATLTDTLFPIPQTEINLYGTNNPNFQQNPGW
jgi:hypothetical protein